MSALHQFGAVAVAIEAVALLGAASWSAAARRVSDGARDHRFAVDRLILIATASVAATVVVGLVVAAGGRPPADPLHLLYAPIALVTPLAGWWLGGRATNRGVGRIGRDGVIAIAALVVLALDARLAMTG